MTSISRLGQIVIRRKVSKDSTHYLERDELWGLRRLPNKSAYVFVNERSALFGRMGIAMIIERAGAEAGRVSCRPFFFFFKKKLSSSTISAMPQSQTLFAIPGMSPEPFRDPWRGRR